MIYDLYITYRLKNSLINNEVNTEVNLIYIDDLNQIFEQKGTIKVFENELNKIYEYLQMNNCNLDTHFTPTKIQDNLFTGKIYHLLYIIYNNECVWTRLYEENEYQIGMDEYNENKKDLEISNQKDEDLLINFEKISYENLEKKEYGTVLYEKNDNENSLIYSDKCRKIIYEPITLQKISFDDFKIFLENKKNEYQNR